MDRRKRFSTAEILLSALLLCFGSTIGLAQQGPGDPRPIIATSFVAIVWPEGYSEVYSPHSGFVSNIDFTVFGPTVRIETTEAIYDFSVRWTEWSLEQILQDQQDGNADASGFPTYWPATLPSRTGPALYAAIPATWAQGVQAPNDAVLLDMLHQYYQENRVQIDAGAQQARLDQAQARANEAALQAAATEPPEPPVVFDRIEVAAPTPTPPQT